MIRRLVGVMGLWIIPVTVHAASAQALYPIDSPLGGPQSIYSKPLLKVLKSWPPKNLPELEKTAGEVKIQAFDTPDNDTYIGLEQFMIVKAPLSKVEAVLDDLENYPKIFEGLLKLTVSDRDKNRFLTHWEQNVPIPFIANEKSEMAYLVDKSRPDRKVYRYSLKSGNYQKFDDGMIVIEANGKKETRYTEFDFFDADWGIAKSFGSLKIWKDSVEGLYQSDLAVKFRSEHPEWSFKQVLDKSKDQAGDAPIKERLKVKTVFRVD